MSLHYVFLEVIENLTPINIFNRRIPITHEDTAPIWCTGIGTGLCGCGCKRSPSFIHSFIHSFFFFFIARGQQYLSNLFSFSLYPQNLDVQVIHEVTECPRMSVVCSCLSSTFAHAHTHTHTLSLSHTHTNTNAHTSI